uniref:Scavenger receptor class B member 1 n=1 Tax=Schistocephalus solidus TaxID=70667 RepID=A0A0X3PDM7_SCHSO
MTQCSPRCSFISLLLGMVVSTLTAIICSAVYYNFDELIQKRLTENIVIKPGSPSLAIMVDESKYSYLRVWLFNLTNPLEVEKSAKPKLKTVGPYVYRKYSIFSDKLWSADGRHTTFTYTEKNVFVFDPKLSVGNPEKDTIIAAKIPDFTAVALGKDFLRFSKVRKIMKHFVQPLFKTTVQKYLWGYDDKLLKVCNRFAEDICNSTKVGLFSAKNNSIADPVTIVTGVDDISRLGHILSIKNQSLLDIWAGHYANMINGTTNAFTPPNVQLGTSRFMYSTSVCRSFNFTIRKKVGATNFQEMELYELGPIAETFHSAQDHPSNADFHVNETLGPKNPPSGVFDLSNCLFKKKRRVPIFFSLPYFHKAALEVRNKVDFVGEPQQDLEFTFNIEPKSGIILEGYKHFQLNLFAWGNQVHRGGFYQFPEDIFYPAGRFLEDKVANREIVEALHFKLYRLPSILRILLITLIIYRMRNNLYKQEDPPEKSPTEFII